ncbi:MAG: hypothetical protein AB1529_04570 [Candidatus Micrarchaeota archaeon]
MERPDMGKPFVGPEKQAILLGRTQSIDEAERLAEQFRMQGYETWITKKAQGQLAIYEVWGSKEPEVFAGKK